MVGWRISNLNMDWLAAYLRRVDRCFDECFVVFSDLKACLHHIEAADRARHVLRASLQERDVPLGTLPEETHAVNQDDNPIQTDEDLQVSTQSTSDDSFEDKDSLVVWQGSLNKNNLEEPLLRNLCENGELAIVRTGGRDPDWSQARIIARKLRKSAQKMQAQINNPLSDKSNTTASANYFKRGESLKESQTATYNSLAAKTLFNNQNPGYYIVPDIPNGLEHSLAEINLHNLQIQEAVEFTKEHLLFCGIRGVKRTEIITGKGNHSKDGVPKLKPALMEFLSSQENVKVKKHERNQGRLVVQILE